MTRGVTVDQRAVMLATSLAVLAAVGFFLLLTLLSHPAGLTARSAEIGRQLDSADALLARSGGRPVYPVNSICTATPGQATDALRQRLQTAAAAAGVTLTNVATAPGAGNEALGGLSPVTLKIEAAGPYDAVLALLRSLASSRPLVFVDAMDLKSQTSSVALKFSGRVFCSSSAPR